MEKMPGFEQKPAEELEEAKEIKKDPYDIIEINMTEKLNLENQQNRDNLEQENVEKTLELFEQDKLLARAMEGIGLRSNGEMDFSVWDNEISLMESDEGMKNVSTSLLVHDQHVPTYKPNGFLVDSDKSNIAHISKYDSMSNIDTEGNLQAFGPSLNNLKDLTNLIVSKEGISDSWVNEVNIDLSTDALKGIFVTPGSEYNTAQAVLAQLHLKSKGMNLPLFLYNPKEGKLNLAEFTQDDVNKLIEGIKSKQIREIYLNHFEKLKGNM